MTGDDTVFKIVLKQDNLLVSLMEMYTTEKKYSINYEPDKWIKPKIGKLFAFKLQQQAESFVSQNLPDLLRGSVQIWEATGRNLSRVKSVACYNKDIEIFWHSPHLVRYVTMPPVGTVAVDEIKLLSKVQRKRTC